MRFLDICLVQQVVAVMKERLPGPDVTPDQLRNRSWWRGPELFLLMTEIEGLSATAYADWLEATLAQLLLG